MGREEPFAIGVQTSLLEVAASGFGMEQSVFFINMRHCLLRLTVPLDVFMTTEHWPAFY